MKLRVGYRRYEFATVEVEVPADTDLEAAQDAIVEAGYQALAEASVDRCAQCSGWNRSWSVEGGDVWEWDEEKPREAE